jgi:prophage antirepressor-like protein
MNLIPFEYQGHSVRVVDVDGDPWWVAKDVCDVLGLTNPSVAVGSLDDDERSKFNLGRQGDAFVVSEPGLYSLILRSRKPEAKAFKRWITHEVLPQIRKTGRYGLPQSFADALQLAADQARRIEQQERELLDAQPKVAFYDQVAGSKDAIDMKNAAKVLDIGMGRTRLFAFLRESGVLMNDNTPYQEYIDRGYFRVIEQKYTKPDGETHINLKTLVYQRGLDYIRRLAVKRAAS